jgi:hypothetical protein
MKWPEFMLGGLFVLAIMTVFSGGRVRAAQEAFQTTAQYRIIDKNGMDTVVRIVRTSSSGFLISKDNKIIFIPKEYVRRVETFFDVKSDIIK